ncbi:hypothetical protein E1297_17090 [Roseibium sp. RKSG952]|nr:hypothetical protein [Roseibium sp. RKSG952]
MSEPHPASRNVLDQIAALPRSHRPLIVCDVDEVILHLASHLEQYLKDLGLVFLSFEYKLTGNIARRGETEPLPSEEVRRHLETFFDSESHRQRPVDGADKALKQLSDMWDIVFLTNLPGAHNKAIREKLLSDCGFPYPVVTNAGPKGGAVAALSAGRPAPVVFIDDSHINHRSVRASLPSSVQIQFIADQRFRTVLTPDPHIALLTSDWAETAAFISAIVTN